MIEGEIATRILDALEDAKRWRGRMEDNLSLLSHQVAELATEVRVRAEHDDLRHRVTEKRLIAQESALRAAGDGDVDVTVTNTNSASTGGVTLGKAAAATGATGVGAWLFGGGWESVIDFLKGLFK